MTSKPEHDNKHLDCAAIEKLVQRFLDGQLNEEENRMFEEHLDYCLPCDKKVEFEVKLKKLMKLKLKNQNAPDHLKEQLKNIINGSN